MCLLKPVSSGFHATLSVDETSDRGAEMCLRRIPELHDERMVLKRLLDDPALNALAAPVNQTHLAQASFVSGADVLDDDRCNVARRERVEIDRVFYWDFQCQFPTPKTQRPTTPNFKLPTPNTAHGVRWTWALGVVGGW